MKLNFLTRRFQMLNKEAAISDEWIKQASDTVIGCRAQGHAWPKLRIKKQNSKYIRIETDGRDGSWQLTQICRDCGMERTLTTLPGSHDIDLPAKYQYHQPDGYKVPKGVQISRRECFAEAWRRSREDMR